MEQLVKYYRNPDEPISLEDLKSFLWGAATRLVRLMLLVTKNIFSLCYSSNEFLMCTMSSLKVMFAKVV